MKEQDIDVWLDEILPKHRTLTNTVVNIVQSLLDSSGIDYLAITGRTKDLESIKDKIKRKSYKYPRDQLTDLSGIRIIAYFESDVEKISSVIENSFNVDKENSFSKDSMLAADQIGYRSIHYVCDLGDVRTALPEFSGLEGMKFEFQIRTVLQHAWAELAHDRNYKFSGKLPKEIERKLFLYAGMLEIADKGFDELSSQIDEYIKEFAKRTNQGDFNIEINSISLEEFVEKWSEINNFPLEDYHHKMDIGELVDELDEFGIHKIKELKEIIPKNYAEKATGNGCTTNIFGLVRDWMLIYDYKKLYEVVKGGWCIAPNDETIFSEFLSPEQVSELHDLFGLNAH